MISLPPAWKSFYERARDCISDRDLAEARWSAERSLFYVDLIKQNDQAKHQVFCLLQEIATLQGDLVLAAVYAEKAKPMLERKSLWRHVRDA